MSALDIALDMLRSEVGVYAPQEHDPVEAARAELAALREAKIEAHAQRCRADILAECNDALRAALVTVGVPITHEVLAEAVRVKAEIEKLRRFDQDHMDCGVRGPRARGVLGAIRTWNRIARLVLAGKAKRAGKEWLWGAKKGKAKR